MKLSRFHKFLIGSFVLVLIDQCTKIIVKKNMMPGDEYQLLGKLFRIRMIENKGAAFGVTLKGVFGISEHSAKVALTVFSLAAILLILYLLYKFSKGGHRTGFALALILGGGIGNLIDRIFYGVWFAERNLDESYPEALFHGRVVDMLYIDIWHGALPEWIPFWGGNTYAFLPIFNVADVGISIGILVILFMQFAGAGKKKGKENKPAENNDREIEELPPGNN